MRRAAVTRARPGAMCAWVWTCRRRHRGRGPTGSRGLLRLVRAGLLEVVVHRAARRLRVARADGLVDAAVRLGRVVQVAVGGALGGLAPPFVVEGRHHLDQRGDDRVPGGGCDGAVKIDVVPQEPLRVFHRREQARHLLGHCRHLLRGRAVSREPGCADLEDAPRFVHVLAREAVQGGEETQRLAAQHRGPIRDVGPRSVPRSYDAHGSQRAESRANGRTAHADLHREIALGGETIPGTQFAANDQPAHVRDHLLGTAFDGFVLHASWHAVPVVSDIGRGRPGGTPTSAAHHPDLTSTT